MLFAGQFAPWKHEGHGCDNARVKENSDEDRTIKLREKLWVRKSGLASSRAFGLRFDPVMK